MSELDHARMWAFARDLLGRVGAALESDDVLADGLDAVLDVLQADRGIVFLSDVDGTMRPLAGRRERRPLSALEREEVSKTLVREALSSGAVVRFDALMQQAPSASAQSLGIVAALVAPLGVGDRSHARGALYVDYRNRQRVVDERHVELFAASAAVFALLLEQQTRHETAKGALSAAKSHVLAVQPTSSIDDLLGYGSLARLKEEVALAVSSPAPLLVLGESGTGKTMLAQAIATASGRTPVVRVMLGGSDDLNTIASELFGHERGAFTGASTKRVGLVEYASGGTLILDELLNLPASAQRLLLDLVQFGTFRPLGYERHEPKRSSVRIIAATNGDLPRAIREGRLREDLYQRLAHFEIEVPPLRTRRDDVPLLAERFLARRDRKLTVSLDVRRLLLSPAHAWTGNVRQLERVVQRAAERALVRDPEATELRSEHFDARDLGTAGSAVPPTEAASAENAATRWQRLQAERERIDQQEKDLLIESLTASNGVVAKMARELGIARTTLSSRLTALGVRGSKSES